MIWTNSFSFIFRSLNKISQIFAEFSGATNLMAFLHGVNYLYWYGYDESQQNTAIYVGTDLP